MKRRNGIGFLGLLTVGMLLGGCSNSNQTTVPTTEVKETVAQTKESTSLFEQTEDGNVDETEQNTQETLKETETIESTAEITSENESTSESETKNETETTQSVTNETDEIEETQIPFDWSSFMPVKSLSGAYVSGEPEVEPNQYEISLDLSELDFSNKSESEYGEMETNCVYVPMTESITFTNISKTARTEICLRDYAQAWVEEVEKQSGMDLMGGQFWNVTDGRTSEQLEGRIDDASVTYVLLREPLEVGEQMTLRFHYLLPISFCKEKQERTHFDYGGDGTGNYLPYYELSSFYPMLAAWTDEGWDTDLPFANGECVFSPVADYKISVIAPEGCTVITSGKEEIRQTENGVSIWESNIVARDVSVIASFGFEKKEEIVNGITVRAYSFPESDFCDAFLEETRDSLRAFTQMYGAYPYTTLDVVESKIFSSMESPALVMINDKQQEMDYCVVAHEVAHQWFYATVGNDQYSEAWLDEGFANFSECIYYQYVNGTFEWNDRIQQYETYFAPKAEAIPLDTRYEDIPPEAYTAVAYHKGEVLLEQLYLLMGEERFSAMIKEYYEKYSMKVATTEGFIEVLRPYLADQEEAQALCANYLRTWNESVSK